MKTFVTLFIIAAASSACDKAHYVGTTETTGATVEPADNTKMNARDRAGAMTPMDQGKLPAALSPVPAARPDPARQPTGYKTLTQGNTAELGNVVIVPVPSEAIALQAV